MVVRHAKAGSRDKWDGADELRPLSKNGWKQAESISKRLQKHHITGLLSSPFVRCEQTVKPLALDRGLPLELTETLAEGAPLGDLLTMMKEVADVAVVACCHGDLIPAALEHLRELGVPSDDGPTKKGSTWLLEREDGAVVRARYLPPPRV